MEKARRKRLEKYILENTKSIPILDEFEGIGVGNDIVYKQIEVLN